MVSVWTDQLQNCLFQRRRRTQSPQCTMSSEPSCTGHWASSYLHQSEYLSWDLLYNSSSSLPVLFITFLCLFFNTFFNNFSYPLYSLFIFFPRFNSHYLSISVPFLLFWLFSLSNSNLQFSICLLSYSVCIASLLCLCLPSYQTNASDLQKSTFP